MQIDVSAHLVLEDGTSYSGRMVGAPGVAAGEACFTTAMAGYEEAASDPSYMAQVLAFSYQLVGNYGVAPGRLEAQGVVALENVDTRALVRTIRHGGVLRCALCEASEEELYARALAEPPI